MCQQTFPVPRRSTTAQYSTIQRRGGALSKVAEILETGIRRANGKLEACRSLFRIVFLCASLLGALCLA